MGNALDSKPQSYSVSGSKIQTADYTNTYAQRANQPGDPTDAVSWGNKGSTVQIGVKILEDENKELYIMNRSNQKVYITKGGSPLPNAAALVQTGKNYGRGPCMQFMGDPLNPTIYMYTGSDMSPGQNFAPIKINSMADFKEAMTQDNSGHDINAKFSGMYGQAAISPFQPLGKDIWSGVADFNRATNLIGEQLILPMAEEVIGNVIPGFGTAMSLTGLHDDIQKGIDGLFDNLHKSRVYKSGNEYDTSMANVFKDPRLQASFQSEQAQNTQLGSEMKRATPQNTLSMPSQTPQQMILKARELQKDNTNMSIKQQTQELEGAIGKLKSALGNKVDWSYYTQMQYGLAAAASAENDEGSLNILTHFATKLSTDVLPMYQAQLKNEQVTPQTTSVPPPKGGSFAPIPWHPRVINGEFFHPGSKMVIRG
jgi:hypothetical protein